MKWTIALSSLLLAPLAYANAAELTADVPKDDTAFTAKALTGAPADIGKDATIVRIGDGFKLAPVKTGSNGWTCSIDPDGTPFCTDAAGLQWYAALSTKGEPPDKSGFIYMMAGDTGTSNHDPYATDKTHWVRTGPHVMIVGKAAQEMAANYPRKLDADPTHPYVMYPGTKFQHLMLPADMAGHAH